MSFEKLEAIPDYETSDVFTELERAALRYADAMCERSVDVPDAIFDELKRYFNDRQIVELTATIALENFRARFNRALLVPSDELCQLPADHPAMKMASRFAAGK